MVDPEDVLVDSMTVEPADLSAELEVSADPVRLAHVRCDEPSGLTEQPFEIAPALPDEKTHLVEEIARTRPASYVDALDFTRDRLELRDTVAEWRAAGMVRERQVLVARRHGAAVAALVLEVGPPSASLLGQLDTARLYPLALEGPDAFVALLDAARAWYAQRGRASFVLVREDEGEDGYPPEARLHETPGSRTCLWLLSARMLPEFLEYVSEATVGRLTPDNRTA